MSHLTVRGLPVSIPLKTCTSMMKMILRKDRIKKIFVRELSEIHGRYAKLAVLEFTSELDTRLAQKRLNGLDFIFDGTKYPLSAEMEDYTKPTPYYNNSNQSNRDNFNSSQSFSSGQNYSQAFVQYPGVNPNLQQQGISNLGFRDTNPGPAYENLYTREISQTYQPSAFNQSFQQPQGMRSDYHRQDSQSDGRDRNYNNGGSSKDFGSSRSIRDSGSRGGKRDFGSRGGKRDREVEFNGRGSRKFSRQGRSRSPGPRHDYQDQANKIDMEIEILRKQRMIVEEERRLLMEKKKLEILKECGPQAVLEFEQRGSITKRRRSPSPQKYRRSFADKFSGPRGPDKFMGPSKGHRNDRPQDFGQNPKRRRTRPGRAGDNGPNNSQGNTKQKQAVKNKPEKTDTGKKAPPRLPDGVIPKFVLPCKKILFEMNDLIYNNERTPVQSQKLSKLITLGLRKRLFEAIKDKPYMSTVEIHKLYRRLYPLSTDKVVIDNVLKAVKKRRETIAVTKKTEGEEPKATGDSSGEVKEETKKDKDDTQTTSGNKTEDGEATKTETEAKDGDDTVTNNEDGEKENEVTIDEVGDKVVDGEADHNGEKIDQENLEEETANAEKADTTSAVEESANESNNVSVEETNEENLLTSDANDGNDDASDATADNIDTAEDNIDTAEDNIDTAEDQTDATVDKTDTTVDETDTNETDANGEAVDANDTTANELETDKSTAINKTEVDVKDADCIVVKDVDNESYDEKVNDILNDVDSLVGKDIEAEVDNWIEGGNVGWDDIEEL